MATVKKRPLTSEEIEECRRLAQAWERHKQDNPGASQNWLGQVTGLGGQSLISQYFRGVIPLNVRALLTICKHINADPQAISPRLMSQIMPAGLKEILSDVRPAARDAIEAILRAEQAGESDEVFRLVLRLFPPRDEAGELERS
ncbi:hypothetical protein [Burkholderia gladioli]|uniref:hypothetical protein n=1 Tax=Burkholderia gladioli TaxID=28095 RepID=UPI0016417AA2|nr:hypothetical protein [Burkholderia gladioli]